MVNIGIPYPSLCYFKKINKVLTLEIDIRKVAQLQQLDDIIGSNRSVFERSFEPDFISFCD